MNNLVERKDWLAEYLETKQEDSIKLGDDELVVAVSDGSVGFTQSVFDHCCLPCKACTGNRFVLYNSVEDKNIFLVDSKWRENVDGVILSGLVMEEFFRRHSLKPTTKELDAVPRGDPRSDKLVWRRITNRYERARLRVLQVYNIYVAPRTLCSLMKKWKESAPIKTRKGMWTTREQEDAWRYRWNRGDILACDEQTWERLKTVARTLDSCSCN